MYIKNIKYVFPGNIFPFDDFHLKLAKDSLFVPLLR